MNAQSTSTDDATPGLFLNAAQHQKIAEILTILEDFNLGGGYIEDTFGNRVVFQRMGTTIGAAIEPRLPLYETLNGESATSAPESRPDQSGSAFLISASIHAGEYGLAAEDLAQLAKAAGQDLRPALEAVYADPEWDVRETADPRPLSVFEALTNLERASEAYRESLTHERAAHDALRITRDPSRVSAQVDRDE